MKLIAAGQEYIIENNSVMIETVLNIVDQVVRDHSLVFCGFEVNREEFYDDLAQLVADRGETIETIEAILLTQEQWRRETLHSVKGYLQNALPLLETLYQDFYDSPSERAWQDFGKLIESIEWISKVAEFTDSQAFLDCREEVRNLELAVSQQDNGQIGDIIQFEIIPRFEKAIEALSAIDGGKTFDIN
ncbi:hypothetical protein HPY31_05045 [Brevibacillus sp. HB1.3]|uniref:hypothetical protein n=1 Tax=Brevibacillus sp. HB1.3 TaxID=2738842 RepID=UPI0015563119|nr:hypothetical protein [Brevibacillus sp. HB1.3]NQF13284.1 hypothetical protein [Brevibacillus sp. HB1.3]